MTQLQEWGTEMYRKIYAREGITENVYGVLMGKLRGLAKKLKRNHPLALELWNTGNADARLLAAMIMDPAQPTANELKEMVLATKWYRLVDELSWNVLAPSPHAETLRESWMPSKDPMLGRAGWNLLIAKIDDTDDPAVLPLDQLLKTLETEMLAAPVPKQEAMNRSLAEIGIKYEPYRARCIAIGEKLGRFDKRPVPKGCTAAYAPEWIAAVLARNNGFRK